MNQENPSSSSIRKLKFTPKAPKRRPPTRASQSTSSGADEDEDAESQLLLKRFQEKLQGRRHTTENKPSVRVAFGPGATTPTTTSQTGIVIRDGNKLESGRSNSDLQQQIISSSTSTVKSDESLDQTMEDVFDESNSEEEVYKEPWNYEASYYPTTLPMRRPYSGNPDILDEAEFGEAPRNAGYNAKNVNAARELGFLDNSVRESLLFFQLPRSLPSLKGSVSSHTKGKEPIGQTARASQKCSGWEDLPAGHLGKLLVYNSGAIKLKLGETLYDVYPGSAGETCEQVMAMNIKTKDGCLLGQVEKHAVVSVDVDSIMDGLTRE